MSERLNTPFFRLNMSRDNQGNTGLTSEVSPPQDKGVQDESHECSTIMDTDRYDSLKDESPDDKLAHAQNQEPESTEAKMKYPPLHEPNIHI